jgi:translation initiation factor 2B subunit (eIF-2B alpha/beta/delta family)
VSALAADHTSGSSAVARGFLDGLEHWVATDTSTRAPELRRRFLEHLRGVQAIYPTMALVHQLAARALQIADAGVARGDAVPELRAGIARSCAAERADLDANDAAVARTAASLITEREPWIATLSQSSVVLAAFREARRAGRAPRALVGEARPLCEGRRLAADLAADAIPTWLVVDAALPLLLSQARMVWIGADAVTDRGVLNKVGSFALALAAREHSVPVYALATRRKFLPSATPVLRILEMPRDEVWESPPAGVEPRNVYFEQVPLALLTGIVVEDAVLGAGEAATVAKERELPEELARA